MTSALSKLKQNWIPLSVFCVIAILGYIQYSQFADYQYLSERNYLDIIRAKIWSLVWISISIGVIYWKRKSSYAPIMAVFAVSIYFIFLYGILFRGTEYGMNSHWGDNGYRLAMVCKMMAYNYFADAYMKDLPSMYPPLWFFITAVYAKIIGIEAYQTVKFGYLLIFLIYPWLLYFSYRKVISKPIAAALAITIPFFAHNYLNYIYYEHMTAALFVPWWISYFEDNKGIIYESKFPYKFYIEGSIIGALIFMTYYWWFFLAFASLPFGLVLKYKYEKSINIVIKDIKHKIILMLGVALLSSIFWCPLILSGLKEGFSANQADWFKISYTNISKYWTMDLWEGFFVFSGVFFLGFLWNYWGKTKLALLYIGGLILIVIDRIFNLGFDSIQTRKFLEFSHLFGIIPLTIGSILFWNNNKENKKLNRGLIALLIFMILTFSNIHTQIYNNKRYEMAVNQRIPEFTIGILENIEKDNSVILTNKYIESCYIPYFMFISISNVSTHLAGNFLGRKDFLINLSNIKDPKLFSYVMGYNRYDKIDYMFLPLNNEKEAFELKINLVPFNAKAEFFNIYFSKNLFDNNEYFEKVHYRSFYKINPPPRSKQTDEAIRKSYPEIYKDLKEYSTDS